MFASFFIYKLSPNSTQFIFIFDEIRLSRQFFASRIAITG
jgi:hypothetical protein